MLLCYPGKISILEYFKSKGGKINLTRVRGFSVQSSVNDLRQFVMRSNQSSEASLSNACVSICQKGSAEVSFVEVL